MSEDRYRKRDPKDLPGKANTPHHMYVLVFRKHYGILLRPWNLYHQCFDDEDGDDHFCDAGQVEWWCLIPHEDYSKIEELLK